VACSEEWHVVHYQIVNLHATMRWWNGARCCLYCNYFFNC